MLTGADEYLMLWLIRSRLAEFQAAARRDALAQEARGPRRPLRVAAGAALMRLGARLLGDRYVGATTS